MSNQSSNDVLKFPDTIHLSDGVTFTTNWRNYISAIDKNPNYIRAFNIPMADISKLASFGQSTSVRAYLAMGTAGDISTLKLVLVPVNALDGTDITGVPDSGSVEGPTVTDSTVFDFTSPCPQTCDITSPLFQ
jgi:hypothetical protein